MLTDAFVSAVRRQGVIPDSYTAADIMGVGDGEVRSVFLPLLESLRQNYFVRELTATPDAQGRVPLPLRAVTGGVRSVQLQINGSWVSLPQRQMEEADFQTSGQPSAYFLDGGSIKLLPSGTSGTLRIRYVARPGAMISSSDTTGAVRINSVTSGATTTSLVTAAGFSGTAFDIISAGPAHQQVAINVVFSGTMPNPVIQNTSLIETPVAGITGQPSDMCCTPDCSPFVPLPEELSAALVHRTAGVILRALAYQEEAGQQLALAAEAIERATPMLTPRNEGNPQVIRGGIRRALGRFGSGWRY